MLEKRCLQMHRLSNYVAKAKLEREQVHSKAKDTLEEIIKDQT